MGSMARERRKIMRTLFIEVYDEVERHMSMARRLTMARVLYGYGYHLSDQCINGVHKECTYNKCSCDHHLTNEQYTAIHGTPKIE